MAAMTGRGRALGALAAVLLVLAVCGGAAQAQRADAREVKARQLFGLGRYAEALEIFASLYAETTHPTYIHNIGRCYQNLGEPDKAISSFKEYLRKAKGLTEQQRTEVEGYIAEMEELKRKRKADQDAAARPPPPRAATNAGTKTAAAGASDAEGKRPAKVNALAQPRAESGVAGGPSAPSEHGDGRRVAAIVVGGVGVAALAAGVYFALHARSKLQESDAACAGNQCTMEGVALNDEARSSARAADFLIGGGLVAAGVATYLFLTARPDGGATASGGAGASTTAWAHRLALVPELGPGGAALAVGGTF